MFYLGLNDVRFDNLLSVSGRTWLPQNAFLCPCSATLPYNIYL